MADALTSLRLPPSNQISANLRVRIAAARELKNLSKHSLDIEQATERDGSTWVWRDIDFTGDTVGTADLSDLFKQIEEPSQLRFVRCIFDQLTFVASTRLKVEFKDCRFENRCDFSNLVTGSAWTFDGCVFANSITVSAASVFTVQGCFSEHSVEAGQVGHLQIIGSWIHALIASSNLGQLSTLQSSITEIVFGPHTCQITMRATHVSILRLGELSTWLPNRGIIDTCSIDRSLDVAGAVNAVKFRSCWLPGEIHSNVDAPHDLFVEVKLPRPRRKLRFPSWFGWRMIRSVGNLQVLTRASYTSLFLVPILAGCWSIARDQLNKLSLARHELASTLAERVEELVQTSGAQDMIRARLELEIHTLRLLAKNLPVVDQLGSLPWEIKAAFFAAAAVVVGHLLYQSAAPELVRAKSLNEHVAAKAASFDEGDPIHIDQLQESIQDIQDVATQWPHEFHPAIVRRPGSWAWVPPLSYYRFKSPSGVQTSAKHITIDSGAHASYIRADRQNRFRQVGAIVCYWAAFVLLACIAWRQCIAVWNA